jgi:pimeloyl-ACP methyl ester carboxylesterase
MRITRFGLFAFTISLFVGAGAVSCSESTPAALTTPDGGTGDGGATSPYTTTAIPATDSVDSVYGDPGPLTADDNARGNIVKLASDAPITVDTMQAKLTSLGYTGKPLTSGAIVYRVSYRTERGDDAKTPVAASAFVYAPTVPRADKLPIIVGSHASRGQAAKCAVTKLDPSLAVYNDDFYAMAYSLVGHGYVAIFPDLAGYTNFGAPGNPPSAYAQAADVARSTLDGARALPKIFPSLDAKVVLVGHSQGGHTTLAALALADSYGTPAPIVGVATYAPLWLSQRTWGAVAYLPVTSSFPLASSAAGNVSVWYHYTQAELLDGPGEGKKLFNASKQDAITSFVQNECWGTTALTALGTVASDLYSPEFLNSVPAAAATGSDCGTDALCKKWVTRYTADRPHLTGTGATTPIFVAYGLGDTTIPPERMRCALDRLQSDQTKLTVCVDQAAVHGGAGSIVAARGDYVADWIGSVALGEPAPAACATNDSALTKPCATPPPND